MHWIDWQKYHEQWNFLLFLDLIEGNNTNPGWWQSQPESVSGWLCEFFIMIRFGNDENGKFVAIKYHNTASSAWFMYCEMSESLEVNKEWIVKNIGIEEWQKIVNHFKD